MPDWTYAPVLRPLLRRLGPQRGARVAVDALARTSALPGGAGLIRLMAWSSPVPDARTVVLGRALSSPVGVTAGLDRDGRAACALEALGAGFVEVGPVSSTDGLAALPRLRGLLLLRVAPGAAAALGPLPEQVDALVVDAADAAAVAGRGRPVLAAVQDEPGAVAALAAGAAGVVVPAHVLPALPPGTVALVAPDVSGPDDVPPLLDAGAALVGLSEAALRRHGPGLPQRCAEAVAARTSRAVEPAAGPATGWVAGVLIGLALVATGVGAAAISLGPVLLGYDRAFLGGGTEVLDVGRLLPFVQHDRITFAGVGLSIGILYLALAWYGMRQGRRWARATLAASCAIGMATLLLFLGFGYFDPLHAAVTTALLPLLLLAVLRPLPAEHHRQRVEPPLAVRERALVGQLLLVVVAVGLLGGGLVICAIGVSGVFVPSDLTYLGVTPDRLRELSDRIIPFVAHDRAGFGGALVAQGMALLGLALWGVRPGRRWLWWTVLAAGTAAFVPTVAIHVAVGYTDVAHLAPVYLAGALAAAALVLTRPYLHHRSGEPRTPPVRPRAGAGSS